jgi:hypothetical protein
MEFRQGETNQPRPAQAPTVPAASHSGHVKGLKKGSGMLKLSVVSLLFACTILFIALIAYLATIRFSNQTKYVDTSEYQAVFLNGGQVYFGHINALNSQYTRINDIYYLQVNQQVQPNQSTQTANNVSLVKLGCELHGPEDSMVINQTQIIFWENLKSDGKVAQAIATYKQQNPNGQNCSQNQSSSSTTPATKK